MRIPTAWYWRKFARRMWARITAPWKRRAQARERVRQFEQQLEMHRGLTLNELHRGQRESWLLSRYRDRDTRKPESSMTFQELQDWIRKGRT